MPKPASSKKTTSGKSGRIEKKLPSKSVKSVTSKHLIETNISSQANSVSAKDTNQNFDQSKTDAAKYEIQVRIARVKPEATIAQKPTTEVTTDQPAKSSQVWWWMLVGLFIGFASVMLVYFLVFKGWSWPVAQQTSPTPAVSAVLATAEPEIDLSQYSVEVLNGAGVAGIARKVKDLLLDAGFTQVEVGNASVYDYQETEISVKEDLPEVVFDKITQALTDFTIRQTDDLSVDEVFDIKIIVGQLQTSPTSEPEPEEGQI